METREILLRKTIPVFVNSFNQPTYLRNLITKLITEKFCNINIIDNQSSNLETLNYYKYLTQEYKKVSIYYYNANMGPRYFHLSGLYKILGDVPHIYTDPDLDFDFLAIDFLSQLLDLAETYKIAKVGCALEIPNENEIKSDLIFTPPHENGKSFGVRDWELQFWRNPLESDVYNAPIDTTFHLFNPKYFSLGDPLSPYLSGIRVAKKGFVMKHMPWYKDDRLPDSERNFYSKTGYEHNSWRSKL